MSDRIVVDLFAEDRAHEEFIRSLIARVANEIPLGIRVRVRSARGGHGRALSEFKLYQRLLDLGNSSFEKADVVVVAIDGNCSPHATARNEIQQATVPTLIDRVVIACPDPHVERWYLGDPQAVEKVIGYRPSVGPRKCARHHYKRILADSIVRGGNPATLGGAEFAAELVNSMDMYRAGRASKSLKAFLDDLRVMLHRFT